MQHPYVKTADEIAELKNQWDEDPTWDLEETEGFEAVRSELRTYRLQKEAVWKREREKEKEQELQNAAFRFGTGDNPKLTEHLLVQEKSLAAAHEQIQALQGLLDDANAEAASLLGQLESMKLQNP